MAETRQKRFPDGAVFCLVAALLAAGSVLAQAAPRESVDWQPVLAWSAPWRWWSAAFVHYSGLHLAANMAGVALVAAFGWTARVPTSVGAAWFVAWPLTHLALLVQPALAHYGGMSGVLHAGVALVAMRLVAEGPVLRRLIGTATLAGLAIKILNESPWAGPLRHSDAWDIAVAPMAHATGAVIGVLLGLLGLACAARRQREDRLRT